MFSLIASISVPLPGHAQPAIPLYRNLIMKGGGIRGIAYGGALQELERQGVLASITRVGGTSAGAIQAALLAVGYAPAAITDIINRTPVQRLNDGRFIFIGGGSRLLRQFGWYRGNQLATYLCELVGRQTQRPNLTLAELHALALAQPGHYRDLYTTGTNLTRQCTQVFSYETHPTMRVADAVRISMSIPLYFRAVLLDADNQVIQGKPKAGQPVQVLVDGGLLANYPLHMFDLPRYLPAGLPPGTTANPETLGLRLDRAEQIALDTLPTGRPALAPYDIHDFPSYIGALYTVALENLNPALPTDWPRTISISTLGYGPKVRRISAAQKEQLLASGRQGVQAFFSRQQAAH
ncbi:hypothetical protein GCM10027422_41240 [Hymenobacter arcticus]